MLVDASVFVFRAWFAIRSGLADAQRRPVNAVFGFGQWLAGMLAALRPARVALAFDESLTSSFRNEFFPAYKANREAAPEALKYQFLRCRELGEAAGLACLSSPVYEADDLIATLAGRERSAGRRLLLLSRDKDLAQLVGPGDEWWDFPSGRRVGHADVPEVFGVAPPLIPDYLGLVGDKVDNIPGVPGVGPATAKLLLGRFAGLEALYAGLEAVPALGFRGAATVAVRLAEHRETAFLSRRLARLEHAAPLPDGLDLARRPPVEGGLESLAAALGFSEGWAERLRDAAATA